MFRGRLVPCNETPQRLDHVLSELADRKVGSLRLPNSADMKLILRIHTQEYVDFLSRAWDDWMALDPSNVEMDILPSVWPNQALRRDVEPRNFSARVGQFAFDAGSPITSGTWQAALAGAACAADAARAVFGSQREVSVAMALTRPPGHHAGANFFGGYCFLNNAALAAQALRDAGASRIAVLDVDYHHGNGTQSIFYERGDVFTISIHGDPRTEYPFYLGYADETGAGLGLAANLNLPLAPRTEAKAWFLALDEALAAVHRCEAQALVVALGVDTYEGDPISSFRLRSEHFFELGRRLSLANLPTVFVMEGGYAVAEMGVNVVNVLHGYVNG